jgi:L-methionine (R)-S-oxide reductase
MFEGERPSGSKPQIYRELALMADGLFRGERDAIANAANLSGLLWMGLADLNWAGFYFLRGEGLVLGPFQGKPACVRIALGSGVCGAAASGKKTIIVRDVEAFPGHIACDAASRSELVVPLLKGTQLIGVLDLDSPLPGRFDQDDANGIESLAALWVAASDSI